MELLLKNEIEPTKNWFNELKKSRKYKEPVLKKGLVKTIRLACNALEQDAHVFVMSVNILEEYLNVNTEDVLLTIIVVIFICSKTVGQQAELKLKHITSLYENMTTTHIKETYVVYTEIKILNDLKHKIPLSSEVDDLKLLYSMYIEPMNLKANFLKLCIQLLELIYINKYNFFYAIKDNYIELNMLNTFQEVISTKLYMICGIILASIMLTKYQNFFDLEKVTLDLSCIAYIHKDHFEVLTKHILELFIRCEANSTKV